MRKKLSDNIVRWRAAWGALSARHNKGQVAVYMALLLTSLMGLAGTGVDYGLIVVESSRLQHSIDAAALAGARALVTSNGSTQTARNTEAQTASTNFLALHGYTNGVNGATFQFTPSASDGGTYNDTMRINATVVLPTRFWRVLGIQTTTLNQAATAAAGGGMVDVMLSLDLSLSMELSGSNDLPDLRTAVSQFLDQLQLDINDPRGSQVGIARWAGLRCSWYRSDGDMYVDVDRGPTTMAGNASEYYAPCADDKTVLSNLTNDKAKLLKIALNTASPAACPTGPEGAITNFACPLTSWRNSANTFTRVAGTPIPTLTPQTATAFQQGNSGTTNSDSYRATGTRIPAAISVVNNTATGYYAWSNANGGRNGQAEVGYARKVLVIMTDGFNQFPAGVPSNYPNGDPTAWNTEMKTLATTLKRGADGILGNADDVEIYMVGFFCTPYNSSSSESNWCRSRAAGILDANGKHPCPNGVKPTSSSIMSSLDNDLNDVSSSASGTCTHYFPISKSTGESLPQLFRVIAGSIARGRLE